MVDISSIVAASGTTTAVKAPEQTLGQDQFLNLLVAQLKNQNPLDPFDDAQMMAQLAQFSQLEQTKQMTTAMLSFIKQQGAANATGLTALLGKHVTAQGSTFSVISGTPTPLSFNLAGNASKVTVQVMNAAGVPVRTWHGTNQAAGIQNTMWDGKDDAGNKVPSGQHSFTVTAQAADGSAVAATTQVTGVVNSIRYDAAGPVLIFEGGEVVQPSSIVNVKS
jgi:flagellar basal-body rod modification protein FlgD